jgi:hypothetical protein
MAVGSGFSQLQESMAAIGVPIMSVKSFQNIEKIIGKWWWELAQKSFHETAPEEKQLAIKRRSFYEGVPAIQ